MNTHSLLNKYEYILSLLIFFLPASASAQSLVIHFHGEAVVSERIIRLGDIADIIPSGDKASRWANKEVARSPAPGERKLIDSKAVTATVSRLNEVDTIKWQGFDTIAVTREAIIIDRQKIETIIAGFLQENLFRLPDAALRFQITRVPEQLILPTGRLEYQVIPSNQEIIGSSNFSIIFSVDGKIVENCTVRGKLEAITQVVTATTRIRKGDIITAGNLKLTEMDISRVDSPYRLPRQVIGMQAKRTITAGKPFTTRNLEAPPVVRRGELVRVIAKSGRMQISTTGIATMDARPGDSIRVKNIQSDKLISGRVNSSGVVTVIF